MARMVAEVSVVVEAGDTPTAEVREGEIAFYPVGRRDVVFYVRDEDVDAWLSRLQECVKPLR